MQNAEIQSFKTEIAYLLYFVENVVKKDMFIKEGRRVKNMNNVNSPKHYNNPGQKECIEEMLNRFGVEAVKNFCELNAYKYRYRADAKGGEEDLQKAAWYEGFLKCLEINEQSKNTVYAVFDRNGEFLRAFAECYKAIKYLKNLDDSHEFSWIDAVENGYSTSKIAQIKQGEVVVVNKPYV